jgi:hypothetical protein
MADSAAYQDVKEITVSAVVIRKNGTREDHGVVARYDRDEPERNVGKVLFNRLKERLNG